MSRNTDTDPRDADTMTVFKPLDPVATGLNFVDPKLNGRWVFSNQGFNNRVAALQLGVQDKPFVGVQIGGGDNQRVSGFDLRCVQTDDFKVFLHPKCRQLQACDQRQQNDFR